jgi:hypothetical protein
MNRNQTDTDGLLGMLVMVLCLKITKEEAALVEIGATLPHEMIPSLLVQTGLELEEQQCIPLNR